jgi:hypothetical protein
MDPILPKLKFYCCFSTTLIPVVPTTEILLIKPSYRI